MLSITELSMVIPPPEPPPSPLDWLAMKERRPCTKPSDVSHFPVRISSVYVPLLFFTRSLTCSFSKHRLSFVGTAVVAATLSLRTCRKSFCQLFGIVVMSGWGMVK
ncbi:Uncharacterized protein Rs2_04093 [Raphanus sativus]|nr:Uncharacterized protein Rs2_04093 [Raphanus sativus]